MRLNKFIAQRTKHSRRAADDLIIAGRVEINGRLAAPGAEVKENDQISIDGKGIEPQKTELITIMLNKPRGYVTSRKGQGSRTVYDLLPENLRHLQAVGRLDKESSGLLLFTNDGELANRLTHPRYQKTKVYEVELDKPISPLHQQIISDKGVALEDGQSKFLITKLDDEGRHVQVTLREGRNRQIRRTFSASGYEVLSLQRISFGEYALGHLNPGEVKLLS